MQVHTKTFAYSSLSAFVAMFVLALMFYTLILRDTLSSRIDPVMLRTPTGLSCVTLGYVALSILMAWVYPHYRSGDGPVWRRGLRFGIVMGLLWVFPLSLVMHGVYRLSFFLVAVDVIWAMIEQGVGGMVIARIYQHRDRLHIADDSVTLQVGASR